MDVRIDNVNVFNPLEGKLDDIIDCLVEFYGERHRALIEERLHNTEFFFVPSNGLQSISYDIEAYYMDKRDQITQQILSQLTENNPQLEKLTTTSIRDLQKLKQNIVTPSTCATLNNVLLLLQIFKSNNEFKPFKELKKFMEENPYLWSSVDNFLAKVDQMIKEHESEFDNLKQEEEQALSQVKEYDELVDKGQDQYDDKIFSFALKQLTAVMGENVKKLNHLKLMHIVELYTKLLDVVPNLNIVNYVFLSDKTKQECIELCKAIGCDCDDNFKLALATLIYDLPIFSADVKNEFHTIRKHALNEQMQNNPLFQECLDRVNQLDLIPGSLFFANYLYHFMNKSDTVLAYIIPCIAKTDHQLKTIAVCPWALDSQDHYTIHEIGHIIESVLLSISDKKITFSTGCDTLSFAANTKKYTGDNLDLHKECTIDPRKSVALNEIINDYFSIEIVKIMQKRGVQINLGKQTTTSRSSYSPGFRLLEDFIEEYKDVLIDCRLSGDPDALAKFIGEDNFKMLSEACSTYLNLINNPFFLAGFNIWVKSAEKQTGSSFKDILHTYNWPEEMKAMIEQHIKVEQVMKNIKERNIAPPSES